jgi:hypothetical protein
MLSYVESMARVGVTADLSPADGLAFLQWLANASSAFPDRLLVGHGSISPPTGSKGNTAEGSAKMNKDSAAAVAVGAVAEGPLQANAKDNDSGGDGKHNGGDAEEDAAFLFGLAKYLAVTSSVRDGWFLANNGGYSIGDGLLDQPMRVYANGGAGGLGCGEPAGPFERIGGAGKHVLRRFFTAGNVTVNLDDGTAAICCDGGA